MGFELDGFDELANKLEALGNLGNTISNKALKEGSKIILSEQKKVAPKDKDTSTHGADFLDTTKIRKYKNGNAYISIGITKDNWEKCKGLWFQNFNGIHADPKNVGWISKAYEKSKSDANKKIQSIVSAEINQIF